MGTRTAGYGLLASESRSLPAWVVSLARVTLVDAGLAAVLHPHSWPTLIFSIAIFCFATVFVAWASAALMRAGDVAPIVIAALWTPPLVIFVKEQSGWA